ncbi:MULTISPECIES: MauE/DoxX family redox-associated membrane protein [Thermomonosporaceae]|uniref:MauE/DoxX family redox-associated membrane protein n=1 Tax=Thermomonosporaceae TaxID=2012 RepID=UPI00255AB01F|nr:MULTISPECIES: MauE/DoxX family redox-associated membrane protein [Thermomonosporaceae]MDL4773604.1 hypothetical protein [Actinomadura xylanilytica]
MVMVFQNTQVLLLAAVLLAACLAKLTIRNPRAAVPEHVHGVPVPAGLRRATAGRSIRGMSVGLGLGEGVLGLALLVTSHLSVRIATMVAFAAATWVVGELRVRRPDAGCGCFGGLSSKPAGRRSVLRAMLFTAAAIASLGAPHAGLDVLRTGHARMGLVLVVELALFAALSPELSALLLPRGLPRALRRGGGGSGHRGAGQGERQDVPRGARRGVRHRPVVPCARRRSPLAETYATLYDSPAWAAHENTIASAVPLDVWREGCWRFVVFQARADGRDLEAVFAVSTSQYDRTVRAALVGPGSAERPAGAAPSGRPS